VHHHKKKKRVIKKTEKPTLKTILAPNMSGSMKFVLENIPGRLAEASLQILREMDIKK